MPTTNPFPILVTSETEEGTWWHEHMASESYHAPGAQISCLTKALPASVAPIVKWDEMM